VGDSARLFTQGSGLRGYPAQLDDWAQAARNEFDAKPEMANRVAWFAVAGAQIIAHAAPAQTSNNKSKRGEE